jgi:ABC-type glutathione transport system ATPase component
MRKEPWELMEKAMLGTGRVEEKEARLEGPRMLAVTGVAGCGKTQLVLKFMRVHEGE